MSTKKHVQLQTKSDRIGRRTNGLYEEDTKHETYDCFYALTEHFFLFWE